jgi:hypothetical protein
MKKEKDIKRFISLKNPLKEKAHDIAVMSTFARPPDFWKCQLPEISFD